MAIVPLKSLCIIPIPIPMYPYVSSLETLGKIQFSDNDFSHHDPHQEGQNDQECLPISRMFLMAIVPHMYYTFLETLGNYS